MKIVIVLPNLCGGGAERLHIDLAKKWIDQGHEVDFFLLKAYGELLHSVPSGASVTDIGVSRIRSAIFPLTKNITRKKPDIILSAMWPLTSVTVLSWIFSGKIGKLFLSEHIVLSVERERNINVPLFFLKWSIRCTYNQADGVIAVSQGVKKDLCRIGKLPTRKVNVIYNPAAHDLPFNYKCIVDRNKIWGGNSDYNILSVGALKEQKDHKTLIEAFSLIPSSVNAKLIILGEGPLRSSLERLIDRLGLNDSVLLPGFFIDPYPWYFSADLFVLSSMWEGFGNVIVEALECGIPVVSTNCDSGPSEILENGRYGSLVPIDDPEKLSASMVANIGKKNDPNILKGSALDFSVSKISKQYLDYLCDR